jgi:hypothetical protein
MKITINELKRIIREVLSQEAVPPGKWSGDASGPASDEDLERLGGDTSVVPSSEIGGRRRR